MTAPMSEELVARRRAVEALSLDSKPRDEHQGRGAANDFKSNRIGRLHTDDNQANTTDYRHCRKRPVPFAQVPGTHARPGPAIGEKTRCYGKDVGDVQKDGAARRDGRVGHEPHEQQRQQRHGPDRRGR